MDETYGKLQAMMSEAIQGLLAEKADAEAASQAKLDKANETIRRLKKVVEEAEKARDNAIKKEREHREAHWLGPWQC